MNGKVTGTGQAGARTPRIGWPVRSGEVPPLAGCFSPRPESGFGLASNLVPGETAVLTDHDGAGNYPPAGLGGTGKTQLAAAFAHSLWHAGAVDLLGWVSASSRAGILSGYPPALRAAGPPGPGAPAAAAAVRSPAWWRGRAGVAVRWRLSLGRAEVLPPAGRARPALGLLPLLGPDGIPGAALTSRAACDYICGRHAAGTAADQAQAVSSLRNLARVGLVTISPESTSRTVRMHALVQAAIQQIMPPGVVEQAASAAAGALLQAWPGGDAEPAARQALRDCTASLHRVAADLLWAPEAHPVLLRAGQSLDSAGLAGPALDYCQAMIGTSSPIAAPRHAHALPACHNPAPTHAAAGRTDDAIGAYEHCLAQRERARGPGHPHVLTPPPSPAP